MPQTSKCRLFCFNSTKISWPGKIKVFLSLSLDCIICLVSVRLKNLRSLHCPKNNLNLRSPHCPKINLNLRSPHCPKNNLNLRSPHCPKSNLNLCIKTKPFTAGKSIYWAFVYIYLDQKPDVYCIDELTPPVTGSGFTPWTTKN